MYKFKVSLFIFLVLCLISIIVLDTFGSSLSLLSVSEIKQARNFKEDLITDLKINGINAIYDKKDNIYYYNVPPKYEGNKYIFKLNLDGYKYKLIDYNLNIIKVNYNKPIRIIIFNEKYYYETKVILTNLPLININTDDEIINDDTNASFYYVNTSSKIKEFKSNMLIHTRGATSSLFDKKSYRIRFYNSDYSKSVSANIQDFYSDESFILNAVYRDPSKIRDNLATSLWNDISNDFKDEDINSKYVELFINNEYKGLYLFSEPVNRKKLSLNKSTSIIIKSNDWTPIKKPEDIDKLTTSSYMGYEIKYPDDEKLYNDCWKIMINKLSGYYNSEKKKSYSSLSKTFDMNNYIDMIIFNSFTNNIDSNMIKNLYIYVKDHDSLVYLEPWDLEFTFGYEYSTSESSVSNGMLIDNSDDMTLLMFTDDEKLNKMIIKRYWKLREDVLTKEYFNNKLDEYIKSLQYASKRDSDAWYEYDLKQEIERIRTWIEKRLIVMDDYVRGSSNEI